MRKDVKLSVFLLSPRQTPDSRISRDLSVNNVKHGHPTFNWNTIIDTVFFTSQLIFGLSVHEYTTVAKMLE